MIGNPNNPTRERFLQAQREVDAKNRARLIAQGIHAIEREVGSPPRDPRIDWQDEEGPTS